MLLLLLSWLLLWLSAMGLGYRLGGADKGSPWQNFLRGLAAWLLLVQLACFILPASYLLLPLVLHAVFEIGWGRYRITLRHMLRDLATPTRLLLLACCLFPAVMPGWINDDKAYYLQSIQWYSAEGWVQGLGNLNVRYALGSSWHALSAIFYRPEIGDYRLWNFNGLLLFTFLLHVQGRFRNTWLLLPVVALAIPFVNAPSPDLPLLLLTAYLVLDCQRITAKEWMLLLAVLIGLKATAVSILLLGLFPLFRFYKGLLPYLWLPVLAVLIWMGRNFILSGHVLFPYDIPGFAPTWLIPPGLLAEFRSGVLAEVYGLGFSAAEWYHANLGPGDRITALFHLKLYKVVMNLLFVGSCLYLVFYFRKIRTGRWPLLSVLVLLGFLAWLITAPNYRFSLGFSVAALVLVMTEIWRRFSIRLPSALALVLLSALSIGMNTLGLKQLRLISCAVQEEVGFSQVLYPAKYPRIPFEVKSGLGTHYTVPTGCIYCGNVPHPCYPDTVRQYNQDKGYLLMQIGNTWEMYQHEGDLPAEEK